MATSAGLLAVTSTAVAVCEALLLLQLSAGASHERHSKTLFQRMKQSILQRQSTGLTGAYGAEAMLHRLHCIRKFMYTSSGLLVGGDGEHSLGVFLEQAVDDCEKLLTLLSSGESTRGKLAKMLLDVEIQLSMALECSFSRRSVDQADTFAQLEYQEARCGVSRLQQQLSQFCVLKAEQSEPETTDSSFEEELDLRQVAQQAACQFADRFVCEIHQSSADADALYREFRLAHEQFQSLLTNERVASALDSLGVLLLDKGRRSWALHCHQVALGMRQTLYPSDHVDILHSQKYLQKLQAMC